MALEHRIVIEVKLVDQFLVSLDLEVLVEVIAEGRLNSRVIALIEFKNMLPSHVLAQNHGQVVVKEGRMRCIPVLLELLAIEKKLRANISVGQTEFLLRPFI